MKKNGVEEVRNIVLFFTLHAGRAGGVIERAAVTADVVGGMAADHVLVVRTAVEYHVPGCRYLTGGRVIRRLVGVQGIGPKRIST